MIHTPKDTPAVIAPAPWILHGNALMLLYYLPHSFGLEHGQLSDYQKDTFIGGIGAVMCVDYHQSPVGPYQELLFIPGMVKIAGSRQMTISKILVSTYESVWNGIENWGIPKTVGGFTHERQASSQSWEITENQDIICKIEVKETSFRFPMNTAILPLPVYQEANCKGYFTRPKARGTARWCKLTHFEGFGGLAQRKPLAVLAIEDFTMTFPVPKVVAQ